MKKAFLLVLAIAAVVLVSQSNFVYSENEMGWVIVPSPDYISTITKGNFTGAFNIVTENGGATARDSSVTKVFVKQYNRISIIKPVTTEYLLQVPPLRAGGSQTNIIAGCEPGVAMVEIWSAADYRNSITESDETNNRNYFVRHC